MSAAKTEPAYRSSEAKGVAAASIQCSTCAACLESSLEFFGERVGFTYARCDRCGTIQLCPLPSAADLELAYAHDFIAGGHHYSPEEALRGGRPFFGRLAEQIRSGTSTGPVLEVGCGYGGLLRELAAANRPYLGID